MTKAYIEIDKGNKDDMIFLKNLESITVVEKIETNNLLGTSELLSLSFTLTSSVLTMLASYFSLKKEKGSKSIKIKNKRIVLEKLNKEQIITLIEKEII